MEMIPSIENWVVIWVMLRSVAKKGTKRTA